MQDAHVVRDADRGQHLRQDVDDARVGQRRVLANDFVERLPLDVLHRQVQQRAVVVLAEVEHAHRVRLLEARGGARASRLNRSRKSSSRANSSRSSFKATMRSSPSWRARYTVPIPPTAITASMTNLPAMVWPTRGELSLWVIVTRHPRDLASADAKSAVYSTA